MCQIDFNNENKKVILTALKKLKVKRVTVTFEGSGDSGSCEIPVFLNNRGSVIKDENVDKFPKVSITKSSKSFDEEKSEWKETTTLAEVPLREAVFALADEVSTMIDNWWDNDGGFGEITFEIETGKINIEANYRYTETNTETFTF